MLRRQAGWCVSTSRWRLICRFRAARARILRPFMFWSTPPWAVAFRVWLAVRDLAQTDSCETRAPHGSTRSAQDRAACQLLWTCEVHSSGAKCRTRGGWRPVSQNSCARHCPAAKAEMTFSRASAYVRPSLELGRHHTLATQPRARTALLRVWL